MPLTDTTDHLISESWFFTVWYFSQYIASVFVTLKALESSNIVNISSELWILGLQIWEKFFCKPDVVIKQL